MTFEDYVNTLTNGADYAWYDPTRANREYVCSWDPALKIHEIKDIKIVPLEHRDFKPSAELNEFWKSVEIRKED